MMKVISGKLKGRIITGFNIDGTRPTMDRIKESIFSTIQDYIEDSIVLDLFSGSGSYGIEAISNNCKLVYFNDYNKECIKCLKKNLNNFNILNQGIISNLNYLDCLNNLKNKNIKFDLVFLDPPYKLHIINNILKFLVDNNMLNNNSIVVSEFSNDLLIDNYKNLFKIKDKSYGYKKVFIYKLKEKYEE